MSGRSEVKMEESIALLKGVEDYESYLEQTTNIMTM